MKQQAKTSNQARLAPKTFALWETAFLPAKMTNGESHKHRQNLGREHVASAVEITVKNIIQKLEG